MYFSTALQPYQEDVRMIMKGYVQWNLVERFTPQVGLEPGIDHSSVGQCLTHQAAGASNIEMVISVIISVDWSLFYEHSFHH